MYLQEVGKGCGDWMELAQVRDSWQSLVSTVRNLRVPKMRGISWLAAEQVNFSRTLLHGVSKYVYILRYCVGKGKFYPWTEHGGPREEYKYSCTLSLTSALDGIGSQRHASDNLPPVKTRYPLYRRLGWAPMTVWTGAEYFAFTGIRTPNRPASSEPLYRIRHPGSHSEILYMSSNKL
jgi:hypothetical protein